MNGQPKQLLKVALTGVRCKAEPGTVRVDASGRTLVAAADEWLELRRTAVLRSDTALRVPYFS